MRLSRDTERQWIERAATGDRDTRRRLIEAHLGLVYAIARRYARRWNVPFEDLLQEGALALVQAVDHYDPTKAMKLSTYATWWVGQAVRRAALAYARPVRFPEELWERAGTATRAEEDLRLRLGREADEGELASSLGWSGEELAEVRRALEPVASLEAPAGEDGTGELGDLLADTAADDPAEEAARSDARRRLAEALAALPERERTVLFRRAGFEGEPATLTEIGRSLGISRERARQIEGAALKRLRKRSGELGLKGLAA